MKRSYLVASAVAVALIVTAAIISAPVSIEAESAGNDTGSHSFKPRPPGDIEPFQAEPNCTWTCSDGREGSAEVITEDQCEAACEGACGENCEPAN